MILVLALTGCAQIDEWRNKAEGLANPLVAQGIVLGVAEPDPSTGIDLSGTEFGDGGAATLLLADAASADDLENAPLSGANPTLRTGDGPVDLEEKEGGLYTATGVAYNPGQEGNLTIMVGGAESFAAFDLPLPTNATIPQDHSPNTALQVDVSAGDYDSALVVVIDAASGDVTFSNEPQGIQEIYEFTHGSDEATTVVQIPANAFPGQGVYAVGVAGMQAADSSTFDGMNTGLSSVIAGQMKFYPVSTLP